MYLVFFLSCNEFANNQLKNAYELNYSKVVKVIYFFDNKQSQL